MDTTRQHWRWGVRLGVAIPLALALTTAAVAVTSADTSCARPSNVVDCIRAYFGFIQRAHPSGIADIRIEQAEINAAVAADPFEGFLETFEHGDEMFATAANAADGIGANVDGKGTRFTRVPRADLNGPGQWNNQVPRRPTGPNAQACVDCHNKPFEDAAGGINSNVHRDPTFSGRLDRFIQRNTPHLFAPGAVQRLAEEMTEELFDDRDEARDDACRSRDGVGSKSLEASGVRFGTITARRTRSSPCTVTYDTSRVQGVDADLVVKPFQWKGNFAFLRAFNRDAENNELGMQADEIVGDLDGDADGVRHELTIGDMTAMAIYLAAQPRPTTKLELDSLGLLDPPLTSADRSAIARGSQVFANIGCASCHVPSHTLISPIFSEPSQSAAYRDATFPAGQNPRAEGVDPARAVKFDLTRDQPNNHIEDAAVNVTFRLGSLRKNSSGRALVEIFGDLKRHDLGPEVAEPIDEAGTGASVFLTENLWGVGSTAPYLHDGRATTLTEAILFHGGEAAGTRDRFNQLHDNSKVDLFAFLDNLVLFKLEEE